MLVIMTTGQVMTAVAGIVGLKKKNLLNGKNGHKKSSALTVEIFIKSFFYAPASSAGSHDTSTLY